MQSTLVNIWKRRHLLRVLVSSNLKRQNKNSVLGYLWWLLDPILMTGVYYLLVAVLFDRGGRSDDGPYILFLLCGLLSYKAFADSVSQSVLSIRDQAGIVRSISFPKAVLPASLVLSSAVYFCAALLVAVGLGLAHGIWPGVTYSVLPLLVGLQIFFSLGVALLVSTLGLYFQDTANIMSHLLRMWYFLSPGLYSISVVPERFRPLFKLNPFYGLMTAYRDVIMHDRWPALGDLVYLVFVGLLSFGIGMYVFQHFEGRFVQKL